MCVCVVLCVATWLNRLERKIHTLEAESSILSVAKPGQDMTTTPCVDATQ